MPCPMSTGFGSPALMGRRTLAASTVMHLSEAHGELELGSYMYPKTKVAVRMSWS